MCAGALSPLSTLPLVPALPQARMIYAERQKRHRGPPRAPDVQLPNCPVQVEYGGEEHGSVRLVECQWSPSDGVAAGAFLSTWFSPAHLAAAALPITLTVVDCGGAWVPFTIAAESTAVPGCMGLFAARRFEGGELVGTMLDGTLLGRGGPSRAWQAPIVASLAPSSLGYLYTLRRGGKTELRDGRFSRPGGPSRANDSVNTGLPSNSQLYDNGCFNVMPFRSVEALSAHASWPQRRRSELLWSYGASFWLLVAP